jgi:hypothetical protein
MAHEGARIWPRRHLGPIDDDLAVFEQTGVLFLLPELDETASETVAEMKRIGVEVEVLSAEEIAARFPLLDTSSHHPTSSPDDPRFFEPTGRRIGGGSFEKDGGYVVYPGLATQNLRSAAERDGATFLLKREVAAIEKGSAGFRLRFRRGEPPESDVGQRRGPHSRSSTGWLVDLPPETQARGISPEPRSSTSRLAQPGAGDRRRDGGSTCGPRRAGAR